MLPYGEWPSPLPIDLLTEGVAFLTEVRAADGIRWWIEGRPEEGGRQVLVRRDADGTTVRLTPEGFNARTRVHEYGGAATYVDDELVVVSDFATGRLQRVVRPEVLEPLTPERAWRFADLSRDRRHNRLLAVREDHEPVTLERHGEPVNEVVAIDLGSGVVSVLASGADFYAAPRPSPDGSSLCWLEWRHPNMPWDGTTLRVATLDEAGVPGEAMTVAGDQATWVAQPRWAPDGALHFIAEPNGWMNHYRWRGTGDPEPLAPAEIEFAPPDWVFGNADYGFAPDGSIVAVGRSGGRDRLYRIGPEPGRLDVLDETFTETMALAIDGDRAVLRAASPTEPTAVREFDLSTGAWTVLRRSTPAAFDPLDLSVPETIEFPTTGGRTAYGLYYAPRHRSVRAPDGELPPLIVTSHGGPTASAYAAFATTTQLFTSRGFAVLDVDYGGSTGYGRDYRRRLNGAWGVVDLDDCVNGARWLAERGRVDPKRLTIRGGSASGYTTLCAITFRDLFGAGVSYFGIGDLELFTRETHKFESRYVFGLVGPYPEARETYRERSPIHFADRIRCPALILQGLDDRIVPPTEAERIVDALWEQHVPHAYLAFVGEDHGFRQAANVRRSFEAELSFLGQVFGFAPADRVEPVEIAFLDPADRSG